MAKLSQSKIFKPILAIMLLLASTLISLCLFEGAGRIFLAARVEKMPVDFKSFHGELLHKYDPELGWALRTNLHLSYPYVVNTNSIGLRNKEVGQKQSIRLLAIGDSRTFGDGVDDEQTWISQLQKKLDDLQPGRFEVINAGVCGWNAIQGMKYLETRGLDLNPDMVIFSFGVNEWANTTPGEIGWVDWEDLQSLWGIEALLRYSIKGGASMLSKPAFGPRTFRVSPGEYTDALVRCHTLCHQNGIRFTFLHIPGKLELEDEEKQDVFLVVKHLTQGIAKYCLSPFWDPTDCFSKPAEKHFVDLLHLSPVGSGVLADYLSEKVREAFP